MKSVFFNFLKKTLPASGVFLGLILGGAAHGEEADLFSAITADFRAQVPEGKAADLYAGFCPRDPEIQAVIHFYVIHNNRKRIYVQDIPEALKLTTQDTSYVSRNSDMPTRSFPLVNWIYNAITWNGEPMKFYYLVQGSWAAAPVYNITPDREAKPTGRLVMVFATGDSYNLLETERICVTLLKPFIPDSAERFRSMLGVPDEHFNWEDALCWNILATGTKVSKGENVFPRIDMQKELTALEAIQEASKKEAAPAAPEKKAESPVEGLISIEDFKKAELRVAKVVACEPVKKSDKLLCLQLQVGSERRQVVSGIHAWYQPEELIGKKVLLVYNLTPAKLRGVESCGMILAAAVGDQAQVVFVDDAIPDGSRLS